MINKHEVFIQDAAKQTRLTQLSIERNIASGNIENLKELVKQFQYQVNSLADYINDN